MMRTIFAVLALLLAIGPAGASEIPQTFLDADNAQCIAGCSQTRDQSQCATYCSCFTDGMRTEFTLEEYTPMTLAMAAGQPADSNSAARLDGIATACVQDSFQ